MTGIGVFVSGKGGFLRFALKNRAIIPHADFKCIVTDRSGEDLKSMTEEFGVPVFPVSYKGRDREDVDAEISDILNRHGVDVILLNYNKLLGRVLTGAFKSIYNLHLSLLPLHKGFGAIEAAYHDNNLFYGATIHRVDESMDGGRIVAQVAIPRTEACTLEIMTRNVFRYGCLLQLDHIYRLTERKLEKSPLFERGYFNPPLSIDGIAAEKSYLGPDFGQQT